MFMFSELFLEFFSKLIWCELGVLFELNGNQKPIRHFKRFVSSKMKSVQFERLQNKNHKVEKIKNTSKSHRKKRRNISLFNWGCINDIRQNAYVSYCIYVGERMTRHAMVRINPYGIYWDLPAEILRFCANSVLLKRAEHYS